MKRTLILVAILLLVECVVYLAIDGFRSSRIDAYYNNKIVEHRHNFDSSIAAYEQIYKTIFADKIDTPEVKVLIDKANSEPANRDQYRKWLRLYTQPIFDSLKTVGLTHMHYHLPDGTSFLRMHKPESYGDNIASFRPSIEQANFNDTYVKGFENGRHLLAYRFVFPLRYEGRHIGSVELSVGLSELIEGMNRLFGIGYSYFLDKGKLFVDYTDVSIALLNTTPVSDKYYLESCTACSHLIDNSCHIDGNIKDELASSITDYNKDRIRNYEEFSEMSHFQENVLFTYMPIIDTSGEGVGYLVSHSVVNDFRSIILTYRVLFLFLSIGCTSIVIIFFLLEENRRKMQALNQELEAKVEEKVRELQDKEQFFTQQSKMVTMGEMLASIIHQWKQPISSISLIADLLLIDCNRGNCPEDFPEHLRNIKNQAIFMSDTGNDFRNFMKPSKEKVVFNIADAVNDVIRLFEFSFERYNIGFETKWTSDVAAKANVLGYPNEFKHVLLNLFNNSRDAIVKLREQIVGRGEDISHFKGVIGISLEVSSDTVIVRVDDTGGGIPEDMLGKIFDKYFSTKEENGSGIGLHMTKDMIQSSMNGKVSVRNVSCGAEFTISFPLAK